MSDEDKEILTDGIKTKSGEVYSDNGDKLMDYYNGLVQYVRVCVTRDYDGNRRHIAKLLKQIDDLDADRSSKENNAVISKRNELIDEVNTRKEFLRSLPVPNLEAGTKQDQTSYTALKKLLKSLDDYYDALDISHETTDAQIATIQKKLQAAEKKAPLEELKQLYRFTHGKLFKISGATPRSGADMHKAFSRFQLANITIAKQLHGKHVIIVDDNISTGATVKDAIVSLYVNGIVPKSIVVLAPHRLKYTGKFTRDEKANPGIKTQKEWNEARRKIEAEIKAGDEAHKLELAQRLEDEIDIANSTAALKLATLAINIVSGKTKLTDIVKAQSLIPDIDDYKKFTDIVSDLTSYSKQYEDWFERFMKSLGPSNPRAVLTPAEARAKREQEAAEKEVAAIKAKQWAANREKAKIEVANVETTADKIAKFENNLVKIRALAKNDPKYISMEVEAESKLRFLKVKQAQEDNGYVLSDMKSKYKNIVQLFAAKNFNAANQITAELEREIREKRKQYS